MSELDQLRADCTVLVAVLKRILHADPYVDEDGAIFSVGAVAQLTAHEAATLRRLLGDS